MILAGPRRHHFWGEGLVFVRLMLKTGFNAGGRELHWGVVCSAIAPADRLDEPIDFALHLFSWDTYSCFTNDKLAECF